MPKYPRLILTLLLVVAAVNTQSRPGFIATFPSSVLPNSHAKFCIRFENLNSPVSFTVKDNEPHSFDELQVSVSLNDPQKCVEVNINDGIQKSAVKEITVVGNSQDGNYEFNVTKKFTYKRINYFTLIETDKPAYKPGDKLRIRLLTVDYKLNPQKIVYKNVYVLDPSGSRVNQWLDVESEKGLVDLEMPMSSEPNLGKWTIEVHDGQDYARKVYFDVKKYVLPRFEVSVNHKKKISSSENSVLVSVCSKYSHGGNVKGSFNLNAYTKRYYNDEKIASLNKTEQGKGCVDFEINLKEIGVEPRNYISAVHFSASVTESSTGISASSNSTATISFNNFEADFIEPSYYKPGFPINFKIFIKSGDDQPLKNEKVEVHLMSNSDSFFKQSFQTDKSGYLEFNFDPNSCSDDCKRGQITESPGTITIKIIQLRNNDSMGSASKYHYIKPWTSKTNSLIQIFKPESAKKTLFACNDIIKSKIFLRSPNQLKGNVYYQIQSRSSVLVSGYYNIESNRVERDSAAVSNSGPTEVRIRTIKTNQIVLNDTSAYKFVEENTKIKNECLVKVDLKPGPLSTEWYYNSDNNRCFQLTSESAKSENSFSTKKECEDQCRFKQFYFNAAGAPVISIKSPKTSLNEKQLELIMKLDDRMSPEIKILLYSIVDGEIVADSLSLELNKCLTHKVNMSLQETSLRVGKRASIEIKSEPNSICALSAIDKSVTFMGARNSIDLTKIYDGLADLALIIDSDNLNEDDNDCQGGPIPIPMPRPVPRTAVEVVQKRRFIMPSYFPSRVFDSTKAFKDGRVIYLTDFTITKECVASSLPYLAMARSGAISSKSNSVLLENNRMDPIPMLASEPSSKPAKQSIEFSTMRQYFPETWLWTIDVADENGLIRRKEKAPDSITDWIMDAYCVSNQSGVGVSDPQVLKVFQPLFVAVNLPYSVVRGETFPVKAVVFNYETTCVPIKVEIVYDRSLMLDNIANKVFKTCICPDEELPFEFNLKAVAFDNENGIRLTVKVISLDEMDVCNEPGKKVTKYVSFQDSESRNILVEPEGIPKEHVDSSLIILNSNGSSSNQSFDLNLPSNIVPRSSRLYLNVIGDSMGSVLNNLDNLVQQPTGCGEQNMVKFAPIISVARYLLKTFQMTTKMKELTQNYLKIGYQRQLTYRHDDGSFSAFGPSHTKEGGGTWLTAFVLRSLADAYKLDHIKIDEKDLKLSTQMLLSTQDDSDGSFVQVGVPLMSKALAGGLKSSQKAGLSAYVLVSLLKALDALQNDEFVSREKINKAFTFLKNSVQDPENSDTYTLALVLYAFKIGRYEKSLAQRIDDELNKRAIREDGMMYWKESKNESNDKSNWYDNNKSADLEITAYIMLSKLYDFDNRGLASIVPISRWINSNRNSLGGFYSTQDTVVALDALAEFARISHAKNINLKLSYYFKSAKSVLFVNELNRLLLRKIRLDKFSESEDNNLSFEANGVGTVLVQAVLKYNILTENKTNLNSDFEFSVFSSTQGSPGCSVSKLSIKTKYVGGKEASSMAIVAIRLPSGWEADEDSIQMLTNKVGLKRYEIVENKISLYFDQLTKNEKEFEIEVKKKFHIIDTKPGLVSVYDYYEPMEEALVQQFEISNDCN